jgi:hypothetical protein
LSGPVHTNRLQFEAMVDWLEIKSNFAMIVGKSTDGIRQNCNFETPQSKTDF